MAELTIIAAHVQNLMQARYFAAMGVDWMGFDLISEPRIAFDQIAAIREWVEGPCLFVEVAQNNSDDQASFEQLGIGRLVMHTEKTMSSDTDRIMRMRRIVIEPGPPLDWLSEPPGHAFIEIRDFKPDAVMMLLRQFKFDENVWILADWTPEILSAMFSQSAQTIANTKTHPGVVFSGTLHVSDQDTFEILDTLFAALQ